MSTQILPVDHKQTKPVTVLKSPSKATISRNRFKTDFSTKSKELLFLQRGYLKIVIAHKNIAYDINTTQFEKYGNFCSILTKSVTGVFDLIDKILPFTKADEDTFRNNLGDVVISTNFIAKIIELHNSNLTKFRNGETVKVKSLNEDTDEILRQEKEEEQKASKVTKDS